MIELVAGVASVLAIVCGFLFWKSQQQTKALQALEKRLHSMQQHLEDEVRMASRGAFGVGKRLIEAEKRLTEFNERIDQVENLQVADQQSRQAKRILQKTVTEEEPTRNEAKLAALLKGEEEPLP
jgi:Flp pilus assembly protein TadB